MTSLTPRVTVLVNCRNGEPYLREALDSVRAQTFTDWELVFWDNQSTDRSVEIAQGYGDPRIRYFRGPESVPLGTARNLALARARGEAVALLDADDAWTPNKLASQVERLGSDPRLGVVYTDADIIDPAGGVLWRHSDRYKYRRGRVLDDIFLNNFTIGSSCLIRRAALVDAGGFGDGLRWNSEYRALLRLAEHWTFDFVPEPLTRYRVHPGGESRDTTLVDAETLPLLREALSRNPEIRDRLGARIVRYRLAGLPVEPVQAHLLRGELSRAREAAGTPGAAAAWVARTAVLYTLSLGGARSVAAALRLRRALARRRT